MDSKRLVQDYLDSGFDMLEGDRTRVLGRLSMEQLITMYNGFVQEHAELENYIWASNSFADTGKARNKSAHSTFIKELICGKWYDEKSRENTAIHLLDVILARAENQGKHNEINDKLRRDIVTRSISFSKVTGECELTVENYLTQYGSKKQTLTDPSYKDKRIDIYIRLELKSQFLIRD